MEYVGEKELNNKLNDFKNHLENADRMILSAKFGEGKSFFLQKIREDNKRFSEYEFITIYPVNYVVSPNEDIFEYIKRDILIQLANLNLLSGLDLEKLITSIFSFENFKEVISFLFSCIPGGKIYSKLLDKASEISQQYKEQKATYEKYFGTFKVQRGGLYEDDAYTQIIKEALSVLKNGYDEGGKNNPPKKPVLIIEDLDRLDPAHLFRILNVISAHIDDCSKPDKVGNKFGFSNIVIVMDYETTQHIFEHFYGKEASYAGYMSKFLTEEPFRYSFAELALPKLKERIIQEVGISKDFFDVFTILNLKLSKLSMRDIVRLYDLVPSIKIYSPTISTNYGKLSTSLPIFKLLIYMTELGMSCRDIDEDLTQRIKYTADYLKLLFPLLLIDEVDIPAMYDYEKNFIEVVLRIEKDIITGIDTKIYSVVGGKVASLSILQKFYSSYCRLLENYISFASLNRSEDYSIPNYSPRIIL